MNKYELIQENKALRAEKAELYEQLKELKNKLDPIYILATKDDTHINDITNDINQEKMWIKSENQSLANIKYKISEQSDYISDLKEKLSRLYDDKSYAYDCKNYDRIGSIKADIDNIKERISNAYDKKNSLIQDRNRLANYISSMIENNKVRYEKRSEYYESRNRYLAYAYTLREERNELYQRLEAIKKQIQINDQRIQQF